MWIIKIILGTPGYDKELTCDSSECAIRKGKLTLCESCPIFTEQKSNEQEEKKQWVVCGTEVTYKFIGEEADDGVLCASCTCKGYYFFNDKNGGVCIKNEKGEIIPIQVMTYSGKDRDEIRARLLNLTNVNFD